MWAKFLALAAVLAGGFYLVKAGGFLDGPADVLVKEAQGGVVLYGTSWCGECAMTRKLLEQKGIRYVEYDIESTDKGRRDFETLNGRGVPVLIVGNEVIHGYRPKRILAALGKD